MKTLLVINSSGRVSRSVTRSLTARFGRRWLELAEGGRVVERDVGLKPPRPVDEAWIASAFGDANSRVGKQALAESDALIDELACADAVVIGAPMYNFGMPASLKAYFDQIVRVNRTFSFDPEADEAYTPLLKPRPVAIVISTGDGSLHPGGALEELNFLEPHLRLILDFIGLGEPSFVRVGYDEFQDQRHANSRAKAVDAVDVLAQEWLAGQRSAVSFKMQ